jgi:hypothetical protein
VSLVEIVIATGLLAMVVVFVLTLLPSSTLGMQRSQDMQAAAAYGQEVLDAARATPPTAGTQITFVYTVNHSDFQVTRQTFAVPCSSGLEDVIVSIQGPRGQALQLGTRVNAP